MSLPGFGEPRSYLDAGGFETSRIGFDVVCRKCKRSDRVSVRVNESGFSMTCTCGNGWLLDRGDGPEVTMTLGGGT